MNIGIIGAGHIGQALTRVAVRNGHVVKLANSRGPQTLAELAAELQAERGTVAEAARAMPAYCLAFDRVRLTAALASAQRGVELPHGSWRTGRRTALTGVPTP